MVSLPTHTTARTTRTASPLAIARDALTMSRPKRPVEDLDSPATMTPRVRSEEGTYGVRGGATLTAHHRHDDDETTTGGRRWCATYRQANQFTQLGLLLIGENCGS